MKDQTLQSGGIVFVIEKTPNKEGNTGQKDLGKETAREPSYGKKISGLRKEAKG